jgi:hypothetical protein
MTENEGNNAQAGAKGSESQEGDNNDTNQTVDEATAAALKATIAEKEEAEKALKTALAATKDEAKKRRLENEALKARIEKSSKDKADASEDINVVKQEMHGIFENLKTENATLKAQIRDNAVGSTIRNAAVSMGAIKPDQVAQLIRGHIGFDDNNVPFIKQNGSNQPMINKETLLPMTIEGFVKNFLTENKHLISSSGNLGAGSAQSTKTGAPAGKFTEEQIKNFTPEQWKKHGAQIQRDAELAAGINIRR